MITNAVSYKRNTSVPSTQEFLAEWCYLLICMVKDVTASTQQRYYDQKFVFIITLQCTSRNMDELA
jgi:hypothetical protein